MRKINLFIVACLVCIQPGLLYGMECLDKLSKKELYREYMSAVRYGTPSEIKAIIEAGADVEGDADFTPFFAPLNFAANAPVVQMLLDLGAYVNRKSPTLDTALHVYASRGRHSSDVFNIIQLLIARGAEVNTINQHGRTPLSIAVNDNLGEAIMALIEGGADASLTNKPGKTLLQLAIDDKYAEAIKALTTTVSPAEIQHVIPAIIALTNPHNDPDKETMFPREINLQISAQLIPAIVNSKLALAKQYLPHVPEEELRAAIEQSIRRVISKSPRIQATVQEAGAQESAAQKDRP